MSAFLAFLPLVFLLLGLWHTLLLLRFGFLPLRMIVSLSAQKIELSNHN